MKKLILSAIVLAMCVPAYAEVLVYKYSASYKLINYTDPNRTLADKSRTEKIEAWVVFNIDSNSATHVIRMDPGNKPTAIVYGKSKTFGKWKKTIGGADANSTMLITTPESDVLGFQTFNTYTVNGKTEQRTGVTFTFIDEPNGIRPFEMIAQMTGKDKKTGQDLFPATIYLPWNLSGITSLTSGDIDTVTFVTGQASSGKASLDFPKVNDAENHHWDVAAEIADLETSQTLASYTELGPLPIPLP